MCPCACVWVCVCVTSYSAPTCSRKNMYRLGTLSSSSECFYFIFISSLRFSSFYFLPYFFDIYAGYFLFYSSNYNSLILWIKHNNNSECVFLVLIPQWEPSSGIPYSFPTSPFGRRAHVIGVHDVYLSGRYIKPLIIIYEQYFHCSHVNFSFHFSLVVVQMFFSILYQSSAGLSFSNIVKVSKIDVRPPVFHLQF